MVVKSTRVFPATSARLDQKKKATFSLDFGEGKQLVKNEAIARFFVSFQKKAMNVTRIF